MSTEKLKRTTQVCSQKKKKTPKLKTQTCSHQIKHSKQWEAVELATIEYHCEHLKEINSESIYEQVFERSHTTCTLDSILLVIKTWQQAFLNLKPVKVNFFNKTFWFCFFFSVCCAFFPHIAIFCRCDIFEKYTMLIAPKHLPSIIKGRIEITTWHGVASIKKKKKNRKKTKENKYNPPRTVL